MKMGLKDQKERANKDTHPSRVGKASRRWTKLTTVLDGTVLDGVLPPLVPEGIPLTTT